MGRLRGNVGSITRLGALSIQSANNISYPAISMASLTQTASSGTTTIAAAMSANTSSGISITGTTINQTGTITTTNSGPISITNSGLFTKAANILSAATFTQSGLGSVSLTGSIITSSSNILIGGDVSLAGTTTLSTGGVGAGNITFSKTINGAQDLTLTAGTGNIALNGIIGGSSRIGTLTIVSTQDVSAAAINASVISQTNGSGTSTFNGAINTNGASGISIIGTGVSFLGNVTTTNTGPVTVQNTGPLTTTSSATFSIAGAFAQTGTGPVTLGNSITAGGAISFIGAVTTAGSPSLSTAVASQPITFLSTVNGSGNLAVASGGDDITFAENVGGTTRLGALSIGSARTVIAQAVTASSITQATGSVGTTFNGDINTDGSSGISLGSGTVSFIGNVTTTGNGPITINNSGVFTTTSGKTISSSGIFTQSGSGAVSLGADMVTSNKNLSFVSPATLTAPISISTGSGAGDITFTSTINGNQALDLTAGTGSIVLNGNIGGVTRIGDLTIHSTNDISFKFVTAASIVMNASSGTLSLVGDFNTNTPTGIQVVGTNFFRNGSLITTNGGPLIVTNSGSVTGVGSNTTSISGSYIQNGTGPVNLAGTITTNNNPISFSSSITLVDNATLNSGSGAGAITLSNTVNGAKNLTLMGGVGDITLSSTIGGTTRIGTFQVTSGANLSARAITASSIALTNIIGTATFNNNLNTNGASGISLSGGAFDLLGNVTCTNTGGFTITNSLPSTFGPSKTMTIDGAFLQNGLGSLSMGGTLTTNNQDIEFDGDLNLIGNLTLDSGSGAGDVIIGPELDGAFNLTIKAGTGDFTCNSIVGDHTPLTNFTVESAHDILLASIGTPIAAGVTGAVNLTASDLIAYNGFFYNANTQIYSASADLDCQTGIRVTLISQGPITCHGNVHLNSGTDLLVQTNGGNFSYDSLHGTNFENFTVEAGSGTVTVNTIDTALEINDVMITAGEIRLKGTVLAISTTFTSNGSILNSASPVDIQSQNTATFNALGGNVGSRSSPILVHTNDQIFAGSTDLADFNGSSVDNTVHEIISNPPCVIIFNGVTLQNCHGPVPPIPSSGGEEGGFFAPFSITSLINATAIGVGDSQFNLASDFFFFFYLLDERYVRKDTPIYWRPSVSL